MRDTRKLVTTAAETWSHHPIILDVTPIETLNPEAVTFIHYPEYPPLFGDTTPAGRYVAVKGGEIIAAEVNHSSNFCNFCVDPLFPNGHLVGMFPGFEKIDGRTVYVIPVLETAACRWFLNCRRPAVTTLEHPNLGRVPICQKCRDLLARLSAEGPQ